MFERYAPSRAGNILFGILWCLLAALSILFLTAFFSKTLVAIFLLALAIPFLFRRLLFYKVRTASLSWVGLFVAVIIVGSLNYPTDEIFTDALIIIEDNNVEIQLLDGILPEGETISITDLENDAMDKDGLVLDVYEIKLPDDAVMEGIASVKIPLKNEIVFSTDSLKRWVSAAQYNAEEGTWSPLPFEVDVESQTITMYTNNPSRFAVVSSRDPQADLGQPISELDSLHLDSLDEIELVRIADETETTTLSDPVALETTWSSLKTSYGLPAIAPEILAAHVDATIAKSITELMIDASVKAANAKLSSEIPNEETDMQEPLATDNLNRNQRKLEKTYWLYYTENPKWKRTASDWYQIVESIHQLAEKKEDFDAALDEEITNYCEAFWYDTNGGAKVGDSSDKELLKRRLKTYLYAHTVKPLETMYERKLWAEKCKESIEAFSKLRAELNKEYTITVELTNFKAVKDLKSTSVSFRNTQGQEIKSLSFDGNGKAEWKVSMLDFLKAGGPVNVSIKIPAQDKTAEYNRIYTYRLTGMQVGIKGYYALKKVTPITKEYNNATALAAWTANYAASQNAMTFDDGSAKTTCSFEWIIVPFIKGDNVYGASRLWYTDTYYSGPKAGTTETYVAKEWYDAANPGIFTSLADLKKAYPQE